MINWLKEKFRKTPKIWFVSDVHFGHKNVITYCNRPYQTVDEMTAAIVKIWNRTVKPQDTVYFLGDFSLNPKWSRTQAPLLNGKKILVAGNHDACHISHKKADKFVAKYLEDGWVEVHKHQHYMQLKTGQNVLLSHLPYNNEYDTRYSEFKLKDNGMVLIHGHLHGKYRKNKNQIDVGFDGDLKLWSEDEIIKLLEDPRDFIPTPITEFYKNRTDKREFEVG